MSNKLEFKWAGDSHYKQYQNWDLGIAETCIITIPDHSSSQEAGQRCLASCLKVGQVNPVIHLGYDGTDHQSIKTPDHLKSGINPTGWVKVLDTNLSIPEVACALSHISLWAHCIEINQPIVILEHDALMLRPFNHMHYINSLEYLGDIAEFDILCHQSGVKTYDELVEYYATTSTEFVSRLPSVGLININYHYSRGLHAYAIDPAMARRLFSRVLTDGLINPIDVVVEVCEFGLVQTGISAIQNPDNSHTTSSIGIINGSNIYTRKNKFDIPGVSR